MPEIDVRLDTGELNLSLELHSELSTGPRLDIRFARGLITQGSPDAYREFARDLLDLIDATCPPPRNEYADIPVRGDGLEGACVWCEHPRSQHSANGCRRMDCECDAVPVGES